MKANLHPMFGRASCVGIVLLASTASAEGPADPSTQACVQAYQAAQELRLDGKLRRARENAASCAQETCPAAVRSGCTKWLRELIDSQPSVVIMAREGDRDVSDVVVSVDGEEVADTLTGRPIEVDPGKHVIRLARRGHAPLEQAVVVVDGAKNRPIQFELAAAPGQPAAAPPPPLAVRRGAPVGGIVFGGLGLGSLATFAVLAFSGTRDLDRMRDTCGQTHSCLDADIRAVKTKLIAGDAFLAAGVVSLGVGIGLTIRHYTGEQPDGSRASALRWSLAPQRSGALTSVSITY